MFGVMFWMRADLADLCFSICLCGYWVQPVSALMTSALPHRS
jgi:hypothetical protein